MQYRRPMEITELKNHRVGSQQYLQTWGTCVLRRGEVRQTKVDMGQNFF